MKRKTIKGPMLILVGTVAVVLISVTAVIAFRHFQGLSKTIIQKDIIQQIPETSVVGEPATEAALGDESIASMADKTKSKTQKNVIQQTSEASVAGEPTIEVAVEDEPNPSLADNVSAPDIFGYEKPEKVYQEKVVSVRHEDDIETYKPLPQTTQMMEEAPSEKIEEEKAKDKRYWSWASTSTQEESTTVISPVPESSPGNSTDAAQSSESTDYIQQTASPQSWESGDDSSDWDEGYQEEKQTTNYNVSVSRDFISGSFDYGEIYITLSIYIDSIPPNGLIVKEYIPDGWDVLESSPPYRNFNTSSGEMKWIFVGSDVRNLEINYKVVRVETSTVGVSFRGKYLYNNTKGEHMALQIDGANGV